MIAELDALLAAAEKATPGPWVNKNGSACTHFSILDVATRLTLCYVPIRRSTEAAMNNALYLAECSPAVVIALVQVAKATQAWADEEYSGWSITPTAVAMDAALTALASALAPGGER